jgi:hypothetical protein
LGGKRFGLFDETGVSSGNRIGVMPSADASAFEVRSHVWPAAGMTRHRIRATP